MRKEKVGGRESSVRVLEICLFKMGFMCTLCHASVENKSTVNKK